MIRSTRCCSGATFVVEGTVPDLLLVIPVGDNAMFVRILQAQDIPLALGLVTYGGVFLAYAHHDALVSGALDDGRKLIPGGGSAKKASFAHARAIVKDECGDFFILCSQ